MCDPGGPGGGLKIEPMDTSSTDPSPESLNRDGLQVIMIMQCFFLIELILVLLLTCFSDF